MGDDYDSNDYASHQESILNELEAIHSTLRARPNIAGIIGAVVVVLILSSFWFDKLTYRAWYSFAYGCAYKKVTVVKRPADCDFLYAPIGDKDCHYKKVIMAYNTQGQLVAGTNVRMSTCNNTTTGVTGKPCISFDNGKTWDWTDVTDRAPASVEISWERQPD